MKKTFIVSTLCLVVCLLALSWGGWAESLPSADKIAAFKKAISEANKLEDSATKVYKKAFDEAVKKYKDQYEKAKTNAEKEKILGEAEKFLEKRLKDLKWDDLHKKKNEAFQKIIEEVDKAYGIDTSNVKGEPTFSQAVKGEGVCYPDGSVMIGLRAFSSPGWLASTKKHEATHANQAAEGRWPRGAVERHDAEIEAYGREVTSADTVGLTDAEREDVSERLHYHLEKKKVAMVKEIEAAKSAMDKDSQRKELDKIAGKIRDVARLESSGDEEGAIDKKDDAIKELDELIKGASDKAKKSLERLKKHVEDLKEAELFVIKADTIENLRDARDASSATEDQRGEINKIIKKIKNLIDAEKKGDKEKSLEIKKDALKEINALLKNAKGKTKENLEKAKDKIEKLITIETKITVTGKTEGVGKGPGETIIIMIHTKKCNRYTVTCPPGTEVKTGETVTVTGTEVEPGKIKAENVASVAVPAPSLSKRKAVTQAQLYKGPEAPLPNKGALGSFVITPDTEVFVKADGASSSFFIDQEGEKKEELEKRGNYFTGIVKSGIAGIVTAGIVDAIFTPQEKAPVKPSGIDVSPYYDGVTQDPVKINVKDISIDKLGDYTLSVKDMVTGDVIDYGSPDFCIVDSKTGFSTCAYLPGDLPSGPKNFVFTDPQGNILDEKKTSVYQYSLSFTPSRVTRGTPVFGNIILFGIKNEEKVRVYLTFDPVLGVEVMTGKVIATNPGEVTFTGTVQEINKNPADFKFDTSKGLGQQQVRVKVVPE